MPENFIDIFALGFLTYCLWDGWRVGILRSLLTSICFLLMFFVAIINFDLNRNIVVAVSITVVGAIASSLFLRLILLLSRRSLTPIARSYVFWGSRVVGAGISVFWKGLVGSVLLLLLTLIPTNTPSQINDIQKDILTSQTFQHIQRDLFPRFSLIQGTYNTLKVFTDPQQLLSFSETKEYQAFFQSPLLQEFLNDESIQKLLAEKNYEELFRHPKFKALWKSDPLMNTLMELCWRIHQEQNRNSTTPSLNQ